MDLKPDQVSGVGVAMNEATVLGVEADTERRLVATTLGVLTLPEVGPETSDSRVQVILEPVGRIAASLRMGRWDDEDAEVESFALEQLLEVVDGFGHLPIYGWKFLDVPEAESFRRWKKRLSLDWHSTPGGTSHTLDLFQESGTAKHLALRIWFDEMRLFRPDRSEISIEDFIAGGVRWWDALHAGDKRAEGHGITALSPDPDE